jgi:4'-phosphopantetheinyl transferase
VIEGTRGPSEALHDGDVHVWTLTASADERSARRRLVRKRSREILAAYLACSPERVPIERPARGKPALRVAEADGLAYSVADSGAFGCLAVVRGRRVGIDLERLRPTANVAALATRFLSREEAAAIVSLADASRRAAFFRAWTRKEAYLKGVGGTVPDGLRRCGIDVGPDGVPRVRWTELEEGESSGWALRDLDAPAGYVAAVAVEGNIGRVVYFAA